MVENAEKKYKIIDCKILKKIKNEGVSLYCPKDTDLNPVIKGSAISFTNRLGYPDTKFQWICCECGLIWFSREQAMNCRSRNHRSKYTNENAVMVNKTISQQNFYGGMNRSYWNTVNRAEGRANVKDFFDFTRLDENGKVKRKSRKKKTVKETTIEIAKKHITIDENGKGIMDSKAIIQDLKKEGLTSSNLISDSGILDEPKPEKKWYDDSPAFQSLNQKDKNAIIQTESAWDEMQSKQRLDIKYIDDVWVEKTLPYTRYGVNDGVVLYQLINDNPYNYKFIVNYVGLYIFIPFNDWNEANAFAINQAKRFNYLSEMLG